MAASVGVGGTFQTLHDAVQYGLRFEIRRCGVVEINHGFFSFHVFAGKKVLWYCTDVFGRPYMPVQVLKYIKCDLNLSLHIKKGVGFMTYMIATFRSRNATASVYNSLIGMGVNCSIISTPQSANVGCGLSIKFLAKDKKVVMSVVRSYSSFAGFFNVTVVNGRAVVVRS